MKRHCETCELKGYSPELCRSHYQRSNGSVDLPDCHRRQKARELGKSAMVGAGVGAVATVAGLAAIPVATLKILCGHVLACKVGVGACGAVTGAGINTYRKNKAQAAGQKKQKRRFYYPILI